jgi:hypothetical protein
MKTPLRFTLLVLGCIVSSHVMAQSSTTQEEMYFNIDIEEEKYEQYGEWDVDFARLDNTPDVLDKMPDAPMPQFVRSRQQINPAKSSTPPSRPQANRRESYRW